MDTNGKYINFNGNRQTYLEFASTLLNKAEVEINYTIGSIVTTGGQYGAIVLDCRPTNANGNYLIYGFDTRTAVPRKVNIYTNGVERTSVAAYPDIFHKVKIELLKTGSKIWVDNDLAIDSPGVLSGGFINQRPKIGLHAWYGQPGVTMLNARIYEFSIKEVPSS